MVSAFILINCNFSFVPTVIEALGKVHSISDVYQTGGIYDILVKINSVSEKELRKIVLNDICTIHDVKSTVTMVVAE
jgi:DNA-binding Lrp family transcriptional regulator